MADHCEHCLGKVSDVTRQLIERDRAGRAKYGTTLDRTDLAHTDWLQHLSEELLDAAGYALAAKREALAGGGDAPARKEAGLLDGMRDLQKFIEWNRSSGRQYVKPGFESVVLDHVQRYTALAAAQADGGRIIGSRTIDGVHVIVVSPFSRLLDEQLFVRYDDYLAAARAVVLLRRAIPYLRDEGSKYDDDGSNEPLELAREIESLIDQQDGKGVSDAQP